GYAESGAAGTSGSESDGAGARRLSFPGVVRAARMGPRAALACGIYRARVCAAAAHAAARPHRARARGGGIDGQLVRFACAPAPANMIGDDLMQVILLEKIDNLGGIGDLVKVKPGYARNYLIPKGKATVATPENVAKFEERRAELEKRAAAEVAAARARAKKLEGQAIRIKAQAGPEGKLFGSIGTVDIAEAVSALGVEVERSEVRLPEGPIRVVGDHEVELHLHSDVNVMITVAVESADQVVE